MLRRQVLSVLLLAAVFALPGVGALCKAKCCLDTSMRGGNSPGLTCCGSGIGIACAISRPEAPQAVVSAQLLSDTADASTAASASVAIRIAFSARLSPTILPRSPVNLTILHAQLLI
jgi:hypothetical protein